MGPLFHLPALRNDDVSTDDLIRRFITFVDANPKYTLASTAIQMMLAERYSCKN
jgi:hypothetical protein